MYVLTNKKNVIIAISNKCEDTGEPLRNIVLDDGNIAYAPTEKPNIYQIAEIPEGVEIEKYCYISDDGFYKNPDYKEPEPPIEDQISEIEAALCELAELIVGGNE